MMSKSIVGILILAVVMIAWTRFGGNDTLPLVTEEGVVSTTGLHWHPKVTISVAGENVPIPANIGLIGGHSPMHTHETDGTIHLEFEGRVTQADITIGKFFSLWGKEFSASQLFKNVATETKTITMYVSGVENTQYENYVLQEHDEVEIVFE